MEAVLYPDMWILAKLEDVTEILDSSRIPINNKERHARISGKPDSELFPYYGATGEVGKIDDYLFDEELVALGEDGVPFLDPRKPKAYLLEGKTWVNNHAHVLKGHPNGLSNKVLLHYLNQFDYQGYVNGGTRLKLTQANMRRIPFHLPPLAEQKVIAEKLDTLLAQVDTTKARLERIPDIIKRFRQSVLAAAVSGRLTLSQSTWSYEQLKNVFECIDGDRGPNYPKKDDYLIDGYCLFLSTKNVRQFGFDFSDVVYISEAKDSVLRKGRLDRGDIVITTRGTLGYVASYDENVPYDVVRINSGMLILRKRDKSSINDYFKVLIASPYFQKLVDEQRTGSAQPQLPAKILKDFVLPVPPLEEQTEIVRRVEELFSFADTIEQKAAAALERVNNLTQSILAKAFRGELTADWRASNPELISGDNSAEALLAKIQAEREALKPVKKTRKKKAQA